MRPDDNAIAPGALEQTGQNNGYEEADTMADNTNTDEMSAEMSASGPLKRGRLAAT